MKVTLEIEVRNQKNSMEFEGEINKEEIKNRIIRFLDSFEFPSKSPASLSSGAPSSNKASIDDYSLEDFEEWTIKKRLKYFIYYEFRDKWFTSKKIRESYRKSYNEDIGLSTVSTYLSRMSRNDFLKKKGNRVEREYRLSEEAKEKGLNELENKAKV